MTAGSIVVGDIFLIDGTASANLSGGTIFSDDDLRIRADAVVTVTGGLWETGDKLEVGEDPADGGSLFVNGGTVRAEEFGGVAGDGLIQINGDGVIEFLNATESLAAVLGYIAAGDFTTTGERLGVKLVDVGGVPYTQLLVVPEPSSAGLVLAALTPLAWRRRNR